MIIGSINKSTFKSIVHKFKKNLNIILYSLRVLFMSLKKTLLFIIVWHNYTFACFVAVTKQYFSDVAKTPFKSVRLITET